MPRTHQPAHQHLLFLALGACAVLALVVDLGFPAPALGLRFVSMGDSRGCSLESLVNQPVLNQVNRRVSALKPPADLLVFSGDASYRGDVGAADGQHKLTYQAWLDFMRTGLPAGLPLYLVPGNHEMYYEALTASVLSCSCQQSYQDFVQSNLAANFMPGITSLPGYENLA